LGRHRAWGIGQERNDAGTRRNGETEIRGQKTAGRRQLAAPRQAPRVYARDKRDGQAENNQALQDDSEKGRNGDAARKA